MKEFSERRIRMMSLSRIILIFQAKLYFLAVSESRDVLVSRHDRLTHASRVLNESYQICLSTLVTLHNKYLVSERSEEVEDNKRFPTPQINKKILNAISSLTWN